MKESFEEYRTKLTKEDVVQFIKVFDLDYEQSISLFKIYREKNCDLKKKNNLTDKVRKCYQKYLIYNLNNEIMPTKEDFVGYYNNTYKDDFRCFGYEESTPLTIRTLLVIINNKYISEELTGFENEFKGSKSINNKSITAIRSKEKSYMLELEKREKRTSEKFAYLLKKYQHLLKNLKNIPSQTKGYYVNQNIDKEDHKMFYKLLDLYISLDEEIEEKFTGQDIYYDTAKLMKKDAINEVLNSPTNFSEIMHKYEKYFNAHKTIGIISPFLALKEIRQEAKATHIDRACLPYFQYLASFYNSKNNMYEEVCANKQYNIDFHVYYLEFLLEKMPELKKECLLINEKFINCKGASLVKGHEEETILLATAFINSTYNNLINFINRYKTKFKTFTKFSDENIKLMIKSINIDLYKQVINKETKYIDIIKLFIESKYFSTKLFLKFHHKTPEEFENALKFTKKYEPNLYNQAMTKLEGQTEQKYQLIIENTKNIVDKIINGIKTDKGIRDFIYLDYKLLTTMKLDEFIEIVKTELNLPKEQLIKVYSFVNKNNNNSQFKTEEIYNEVWKISNRVITDKEKEAAINFLDYYNLDNEIILYRQIIQAYISGILDLTPFMSKSYTKNLAKK